MQEFSNQQITTLEQVCLLLGDGWHIDRLKSEQWRQVLRSPEYRHYSIIITCTYHQFQLLAVIDRCSDTAIQRLKFPTVERQRRSAVISASAYSMASGQSLQMRIASDKERLNGNRLKSGLSML